MTNLIPLIVEPTGAGNASVRRIQNAEYSAYLGEIAKWVDFNSVLARGNDPTRQLGQITLPDNTLLGVFPGRGLGAVTVAQLNQMLNLTASLAGKAALSHAHTFLEGASDVQWDTLSEGRILAFQGGEFVWIVAPTGDSGGSSGLTNPLSGDLDLNGFALMSGATELIKVQSGSIFVGGQELLDVLIDTPAEGEIPRFNATSGKFENTLPLVADIVGETPGQFLKVGVDGRIEEVDPPTGGGTAGTSAAGTAFPGTPTTGDSFLRTDNLRRAVYRDDLPIKVADGDSGTLSGWVSISDRQLTVRRDDLDLKTVGGYVFGDGYSAGFYFAEATVISRFSISFGNVTSGTLTFRVNTAGGGVGINHTVTITSVSRYSEESWILIPADSMLSLHSASFVNATPEISLAFELRGFNQAGPVPA